ncbi:hypothetical protein KCP74_25020 [Salmonella enterica subsp. enterica]|nr:hypothetical protein KCP74_25020 [Salmonella enterica subsp. enterica]
MYDDDIAAIGVDPPVLTAVLYLMALRHQAWQQGYADSFTGSSRKSS